MSVPIQETLSLDLPEPFLPTARSLRPGDVLEGHSGKAYPRPLLVHGTEATPEGVRVIYSERLGTEERFATTLIPSDAPVDICPPF